MKKMTTTIVENGKNKRISVWLDDRTIEALKQANDEKLTKQYIIEEYRSALTERKETRRHQSLGVGFDIIDERNYAERDYEIGELNRAIETLTEKQREVFIAYAVDGKTFREIGESMGVSKQSVYELYVMAVKKLKKFLG